jgi:hypothetical protein
MEPSNPIQDAEARLGPEVPRFAGLTPEEGEALAAELGVHLRAVPPDAVITMDYRTDRVTATLRDGRLVDPRLG